MGAAGLSVSFKGVTLHAVSRDTEAYPRPCLFCQVLGPGEEEDDEEMESTAELRLVPLVREEGRQA